MAFGDKYGVNDDGQLTLCADGIAKKIILDDGTHSLEIWVGSDNPIDTPIDAPRGTIYICYDDGLVNIFQKLDDGESDNWISLQSDSVSKLHPYSFLL